MMQDRFNYHAYANSSFIVYLDIASSNPAKWEGVITGPENPLVLSSTCFTIRWVTLCQKIELSTKLILKGIYIEKTEDRKRERKEILLPIHPPKLKT